MQLNSRGQAAMGVGGGRVSIDEQVIADFPAGSCGWLHDDVPVFAGNKGNERWWVYIRTVDGGIKSVLEEDVNWVLANGGVWATFGPQGVVLSSGQRFPEAGVGAVGPDGAVAIKNRYHSYGPWSVIEVDGRRWQLTAGDAEEIQLLGQSRAIWRVGASPQVLNLPVPQTLPGMKWKFRAVEFQNEWWISYISEYANSLVLHPFNDASRGYNFQTGAHAFGHDLRDIGGRLLVKWSHNEGEQPGDLRHRWVDGRSREKLTNPPPLPPIEEKDPPVAQILEPKRLPEDVQAIVDALYARNLDLAHSPNDDDRRKLTEKIAQTVKARKGPRWGWKSNHGIGNANSKDAIAQLPDGHELRLNSRQPLYMWDLFSGTTREPHRFPLSHTEHVEQFFVPVDAIDHLAGVAPPVEEKEPPVEEPKKPTPTVCNCAEKFAALEARLTALEVAPKGDAVNLDDYEVVVSVGKVFGRDITAKGTIQRKK